MSAAAATGRFMYFAFGSNLLRERLQLANPSATFCTTGRLKDYVLNFGLWERHVDNAWHGGVATIEFCPGAEVWGVIWTLSNENLTSLDNQEGVSQGKYSPLEVLVETNEGLMLCRTYQMNNFHACPPSPQYKQVYKTRQNTKSELKSSCSNVLISSLKNIADCCALDHYFFQFTYIHDPFLST
uniref:Gamma-glutamylcyclotransferase n=1 Tax=Amphiprion ocellaris TaxID=80972 RepID=A0A3Q1CST9_AMPOC